MHELSIAQSVVQIVMRHAGGRRVHRVELRVGHLRQVVPSALEFAFQVVTADTPVEGAELVIVDVPVQGRCRACGAQTVIEAFPMQCERCGGLDVELVAGEELLVDSIEVSDDERATSM
jgi:hydrogenase nickel incorporation protein HypA/HybF